MNLQQILSRIKKLEEENAHLRAKLESLNKDELLKELEFRTGRRDFLKAAGALGVLGALGGTGVADARTVITDKYIDLDGQKFYPAAVGSYSTIVKKQETDVWAEDEYGKTIDQGEAGVDDTRVIQSAVDDIIALGGGKIYIKNGEYTIKNPITLADNIEIYGESKGSTIFNVQNSALIKEETKDLVNITLANFTIDGVDKTGDGIIAKLKSSYIFKVDVRNCRYSIQLKALTDLSGMLGNHLYSVTIYKNTYGIIVSSTDNKFFGLIAYQNDNPGFQVDVSSAGELYGCHLWGNYKSGAYIKYGWIEFHGCQFESNNRHGLAIFSTNVIKHVIIDSCRFWDNSKESAGSFDGIHIEATTFDIEDVSITGCKFYNYSSSLQRRPILVSSNPSAVKSLIISNCIASGHVAAGDLPWFSSNVNYILKNYYANNLPTENSGTATFSGDGTTTQFAIAHGLVSTPSNVQVTPKSADAAGDFYITADATYIYINYLTAPAAGTDNVVLSWYAEV